MWRFLLTTAVFILILPFLWVRISRPPRVETTERLYTGITYNRIVKEDPTAIIHLVEIDLKAPGIGFQVTAPNANNQFVTQTTASFLQTSGVQIAINGSFYQETFNPAIANPLGVVISNREMVVPHRSGWPALCISSENQVTIEAGANCPNNPQQAIAGNVLLVQDGQAIRARDTRFPGRSNAFRPQPRTAVALNQSGETMWFVVVDGRQPNYSEGLTLDQLGQFLVDLGAYSALNFDGGGSTTLVSESWMGVNTLNSPVHAGIPTRQRPVPTHLGVYATP